MNGVKLSRNEDEGPGPEKFPEPDQSTGSWLPMTSTEGSAAALRSRHDEKKKKIALVGFTFGNGYLNGTGFR